MKRTTFFLSFCPAFHLPADADIELADWCGRFIREDKKGAMDNKLPHILQRLNIEASHFIYLSKQTL